MKDNIQFTVKTESIKALLLMSAKKDIRNYLNGVFFESCENGINSVATNGSVLLSIRESFDNQYYGLSAIIPRDSLERAVKTKAVSLIVSTNNEQFTITDGSQTISGDCESGKFPDYRRVIPHACNNEPATYSAEYLLNFEKVNKLLTGISRPKVFQNGSNGALVKFSGTTFAIGVIMPMRDAEDFNNSIPLWISESVTQDYIRAA